MLLLQWGVANRLELYPAHSLYSFLGKYIGFFFFSDNLISYIVVTIQIAQLYKQDRVARGKPGPAGIVEELRNNRGVLMMKFPKNIGVKDSNEEKVREILEALRMFVLILYEKLIVESDSPNATWVSSFDEGPWKFHFL